MTRIKAGIIGLGVGEQHIEGYERHPDCQVIALCDSDPEKCKMAMQKYPDLTIVKDATEILDDPAIGIVSIASYDNCHYEQIVRAIGNNKHLFVEKPFCMHEQEAAHIRSLLNSKPRIRISSNLILRKSPRLIRLKEQIRTGELGKIYYVEGDYNYGRLHKITHGWRGKIDYYSVVYGGGVHIADMLLWLTGDEVSEVSAYGNNIASKESCFRFNDMVVGILQFKSGMVGKVSVNYGCVYPHFHKLEIYGTEATFVNGIPFGSFYSSRDPGVKPAQVCDEYPGTHKGDLLQDFVSSVLDGTDPGISIDEIFASMSVCFALEKSMTLNKPVKVTYY